MKRTRVVPLTDEQRAMVAENMGLVGWCAARIDLSGLAASDRDDVVSAGCEALCRAVRSFDPDRSKLGNWATTNILHAMRDARAAARSGRTASVDEAEYHDGRPEPAVAAATEDLRARIRDAVADLELQTAKLVRLVYGIGCERVTERQAADELGVSSDRAWAMLAEAKSILSRQATLQGMMELR